MASKLKLLVNFLVFLRFMGLFPVSWEIEDKKVTFRSKYIFYSVFVNIFIMIIFVINFIQLLVNFFVLPFTAAVTAFAQLFFCCCMFLLHCRSLLTINTTRRLLKLILIQRQYSPDENIDTKFYLVIVYVLVFAVSSFILAVMVIYTNTRTAISLADGILEACIAFYYIYIQLYYALVPLFVHYIMIYIEQLLLSLLKDSYCYLGVTDIAMKTSKSPWIRSDYIVNERIIKLKARDTEKHIQKLHKLLESVCNYFGTPIFLLAAFLQVQFVVIILLLGGIGYSDDVQIMILVFAIQPLIVTYIVFNSQQGYNRAVSIIIAKKVRSIVECFSYLTFT